MDGVVCAQSCLQRFLNHGMWDDDIARAYRTASSTSCLSDGVSSLYTATVITDVTINTFSEFIDSINTCSNYQQKSGVALSYASMLAKSGGSILDQYRTEVSFLSLVHTRIMKEILNLYTLCQGCDYSVVTQRCYTRACCMLVCTLIEHVLSEAVYIHIVNTTHDTNFKMPNMLKDVLVMDACTCTIGSSMLNVLDALVGCPRGLNIRNVLWHGFMNSDEYSHDVTVLMMVVMCELVKLVSAIFPGGYVRPLLVLGPESEPVAWRTPISVPSHHLNDQLLVNEMYMFPYPGHQSLLDASIRLLNKGMPFASFALGISCLEHGLRLVHSVLDNRGVGVVMAVNTEYYTILDDILSVNVKRLLGRGLSNRLYDVLDGTQGPRVRDHVSHGEVDDIGNWSCEILQWNLLLRQRFRVSGGMTLERMAASAVYSVVDVYESRYHPIAIARDRMSSCWLLINDIWTGHGRAWRSAVGIDMMENENMKRLIDIISTQSNVLEVKSLNMLSHSHGSRPYPCTETSQSTVTRANAIIKCCEPMIRGLSALDSMLTVTLAKSPSASPYPDDDGHWSAAERRLLKNAFGSVNSDMVIGTGCSLHTILTFSCQLLVICECLHLLDSVDPKHSTSCMALGDLVEKIVVKRCFGPNELSVMLDKHRAFKIILKLTAVCLNESPP